MLALGQTSFSSSKHQAPSSTSVHDFESLRETARLLNNLKIMRSLSIGMQVHCEEAASRSCHDYSNGGPSFLVDDGAGDGVRPLAQYADGLGVAAVRCQVGAAPRTRGREQQL